MCEGAIGFSASSFFGLTAADVAELRERDEWVFGNGVSSRLWDGAAGDPPLIELQATPLET